MADYINSYPGREITLHGTKYLYFGGTSYLGLQTDEVFQELFIKNIRKYGTNYGASRKSNLRISVFEEAEHKLASLVGSEACATLSSGYLAGQLISQTLQNLGHTLLYAPDTHSALFQEKKMQYDSFHSLNKAVRSHLQSEMNIPPVVLLDSIDFSEFRYPNFEGLKLLPLDKLILVIDDSHGLGIIGHNGGGIYRKVKEMSPKELIVCSSLGKGLGIQAGAIFANSQRISQLTATDFFGGASPPIPAGMATFIAAEPLYIKKRKTMLANVQLFTEQLVYPKKLSAIKNYPAFGFSDQALVNYLENNGIIITNFNYPNENSPVTSRIVISAHHTESDLRNLSKTLNSYPK